MRKRTLMIAVILAALVLLALAPAAMADGWKVNFYLVMPGGCGGYAPPCYQPNFGSGGFVPQYQPQFYGGYQPNFGYQSGQPGFAPPGAYQAQAQRAQATADMYRALQQAAQAAQRAQYGNGYGY